jgi:hypothetical protein
LKIFVKEYNKGNKITDVLIEYEPMYRRAGDNDRITENPLILKINPDNTINIKDIKRIWTTEEVVNLIEDFHSHSFGGISNATKDKKERLARIVQMHANHQEIIEEVSTGDIAALVGLKETQTGDTLCDEASPILIEAMRFPEPVISEAIEPKTKQDQEKLALSLKKLEEEDPSFRVNYNSETGQTIISGMGQLHLEVVIDRVRTDDRARLVESCELALKKTEGLILILEEEGKEFLYSSVMACPVCGISFEELQPRMFSFNSPFGACETCNGLGIRMEFDPDLIIRTGGEMRLSNFLTWQGAARLLTDSLLGVTRNPFVMLLGINLVLLILGCFMERSPSCS